MAVILYKAGNTAKIRGISCQYQICSPFSYKHLLDQDWFISPEACYAKEEKVVKEKVVEEKVVEEKPLLLKELKTKKVKFTADENKE